MAKRTASGRFEISKGKHGIEVKHVLSGLPVGSFSHIAVKSLKQAQEGLERAEKRLTKGQLQKLDSIREGPASLEASVRIAQMAFRVAMEKEFPNGAWSRH